MISMGEQKHGRAALLVALLIVLFTAGCGTKKRPPPVRESQNEAESLDSLRAAVLELIDEPVCKSVSQCRSIAFGSKPCGGPWAYLAYSVETTDSVKLAGTVADYTTYEARLNREESRASDCRFVSPPRLACVTSRCSARK